MERTLPPRSGEWALLEGERGARALGGPGPAAGGGLLLHGGGRGQGPRAGFRAWKVLRAGGLERRASGHHCASTFLAAWVRARIATRVLSHIVCGKMTGKELLPLQINCEMPVQCAGRRAELRQHNVGKENRMDAEKCALCRHFLSS